MKVKITRKGYNSDPNYSDIEDLSVMTFDEVKTALIYQLEGFVSEEIPNGMGVAVQFVDSKTLQAHNAGLLTFESHEATRKAIREAKEPFDLLYEYNDIINMELLADGIEASEYIEVLADRIFKQANHSTGFTGADWAVTTWILGNNHFLCDDENGHHTIVYRDDETELEGVPREIRKMTNRDCIDWLLDGADLSKLEVSNDET